MTCLCEVFENIINRRLTFFLEYYNGILDQWQTGFQAGRTATDSLALLKAHIRDAFVHKQILPLIIFLILRSHMTRLGITVYFSICHHMV